MIVLLKLILSLILSAIYNILQVVNDIRLNMDLSTSLLPVMASTPHVKLAFVFYFLAFFW